jgi:predicted MPP superfamily phosphohydrolase
VGRIKRYTVESERLPEEFNDFTFAFLSDIHYPSKFTRKRLAKAVRTLREEQPQMLLLGGDYVTADKYIDELFDSISTVKTRYGTFAVLGNHEFRRAEQIESAMGKYGINLLSDESVAILGDSSVISLSGVRNPFVVDENAFVLNVPDSIYSILLSHTPDYAQDVNVAADLVLSGHTHGGQVSLFGVYTPVRNTVYGNRFLRGMNNTTSGATIITTNGVGTSRRKIRFCVPSEVVVVTLHSKKAE